MLTTYVANCMLIMYIDLLLQILMFKPGICQSCLVSGNTFDLSVHVYVCVCVHSQAIKSIHMKINEA